jgi:hypothetical protein
VIWNGNPLSQFTKAEQTWVDGRRYFSLEEDVCCVRRSRVSVRSSFRRSSPQAHRKRLTAGGPARGRGQGTS